MNWTADIFLIPQGESALISVYRFEITVLVGRALNTIN